MIKEKHLGLSGKDIEELIREVDYQGNGKINYSEFLSATIDVKHFLSEQRLRAIFQQFDTDNSGIITAQNMVYAFEKLGQNVPLGEVEMIIKQHDLKKDKVLSFDEFKAMFYDLSSTGNIVPGSDNPIL